MISKSIKWFDRPHNSSKQICDTSFFVCEWLIAIYSTIINSGTSNPLIHHINKRYVWMYYLVQGNVLQANLAYIYHKHIILYMPLYTLWCLAFCFSMAPLPWYGPAGKVTWRLLKRWWMRGQTLMLLEWWLRFCLIPSLF